MPRVGETICGYRLLRALSPRGGSRYVATPVEGASGAKKPSHPSSHVVLELFDESEAFVRDARRLASVRHPKLVPIRDVVVADGCVTIVGDLVAGEWLADLFEAGWRAGAIPIAAQLRVLMDVLEGLSALHCARGPAREPLELLHGAVAASNVLVGADGSARVLLPLRSSPDVSRPEVTGYLAPEVLLHDHNADARADVFSAGVLLWEMLSGRRLHASTDAHEIVVRLLGGKVQPAEAPRGGAVDAAPRRRREARARAGD